MESSGRTKGWRRFTPWLQIAAGYAAGVLASAAVGMLASAMTPEPTAEGAARVSEGLSALGTIVCLAVSAYPLAVALGVWWLGLKGRGRASYLTALGGVAGGCFIVIAIFIIPPFRRLILEYGLVTWLGLAIVPPIPSTLLHNRFVLSTAQFEAATRLPDSQ